jgi:Ataxin-3
MDADPGDGHWFNLNSFLSAPEWVGKLYLGMVLQQAESEGMFSESPLVCIVLTCLFAGYSVFAVAQSNPQGPLALNRTEADEIASTLPEPSHSSSSYTIPRFSTAREPTGPASGSATGSGMGASGTGVEGFEDEDMELQAALQASLMDGGDFVLPLHSGSGSGLASQTGIRTPTRQQPSLPPMAAHPPRNLSLPPLGFQPLGFPPPPLQQQHDAADPVAASMARNRMIMERMRREQEMALRDQYEEEVARLDGAGVNMGSDVGVGATGAGTGIGTRTRGTRRTRAEEEEEEMVRRAIEESQASSGSGSSSNTSSRVVVNDIDDDEYVEEAEVDEEMVYDSDDDEDYRPQGTRMPPPIQPPAQPNHRVYDDDDAELQAALKASLESAPEGFTIPEIAPLPAAPPPTSILSGSQGSGTDDEAASEASAEATQVQEQEEKVSVDEMRRRRLARFGG